MAPPGSTATAATGDTTFSLSGVTLTGSNTLIARVENADGLASAPFSRAYVLDQVPPTETATIVAMTDDSGVAGDFVTNNGAAGRTVSGTLSAALATDETLQVSFGRRDHLDRRHGQRHRLERDRQRQSCRELDHREPGRRSGR